MMPTPESCAVAFPRQRNNATSKNTTTSGATEIQTISQKPASIQELRAQLVAQQQRNLAASVRATVPAEVAPSDAPVAASMASDVPVGNWESDLIRDFMTIDGLSLQAATDLACQCQPPRPAAEWLAMIAELDRLIALACKRDGLDTEACERILAGRRCLALSTIPATLQWFRDELA